MRAAQINVGAVFTLAIVSAYTANLATILTLRAGATASFASMEDIIKGGHPVCLWKGAACESLNLPHTYIVYMHQHRHIQVTCGRATDLLLTNIWRAYNEQTRGY
eukprot:COSAG01_NODE_3988_length_5458_cov_55.445792_4_plen_105_part_00